MMEDIDWEKHISVNPEICHGKPCIKGTRVLVETVLASLEDGMTADEILGHYPSIPNESMQALARYAADKQETTTTAAGLEPNFQ